LLCASTSTRPRIARRLHDRYLDEVAGDVDDALGRVERARAERHPLSVGVQGNMADVLPRLAASDLAADIVTDQTPAHDPLTYVPSGLSVDEAADLRVRDPAGYVARSRASMAAHCAAMVAFLDKGAEVFDYAATACWVGGPAGRIRAGLRLPRLHPRLHPAPVLRGQGPLPVGGAVR